MSDNANTAAADWAHELAGRLLSAATGYTLRAHERWQDEDQPRLAVILRKWLADHDAALEERIYYAAAAIAGSDNLQKVAADPQMFEGVRELASEIVKRDAALVAAARSHAARVARTWNSVQSDYASPAEAIEAMSVPIADRWLSEHDERVRLEAYLEALRDAASLVDGKDVPESFSSKEEGWKDIEERRNGIIERWQRLRLEARLEEANYWANELGAEWAKMDGSNSARRIAELEAALEKLK